MHVFETKYLTVKLNEHFEQNNVKSASKNRFAVDVWWHG